MNDDVTFGHWLKRARHSLDLTQEALARQVGCATHTLQKIEQGSRRPSRQLADLLANALQIAPSQRVSFLQLARMPLTAKPEQYAPQQLAGVDSGPTTLERRMVLPTPATALIGRQTERADLMQQLANPACRILTLVGPGGVGKSRLALQLALELADQFSDGVAWVALESVSGLVQFLTAFAEAIGCHLQGAAPVEAQLLAFLRDQQGLLVLDNFEHLLAIAPLIRQLMEQATQLRLLITSRERLQLSGEWVYELRGLPVPQAETFSETSRADAVQLFLARAHQIQHDFAFDSSNYTAVARICALLEGMPLGIELAAAWVHVLEPYEIANEIAHNLDFLASDAPDAAARHRSLHAVFEQSWRLLSSEEQQALRRLSVFGAGFGREAAAEVAGTTLRQLSRLVAKSLVRRVAEGSYNLHELVRQFAYQQLMVSGEAPEIHSLHLRFLLQAVEQAEPRLSGGDQLGALDKLDSLLPTIRVALAWALGYEFRVTSSYRRISPSTGRIMSSLLNEDARQKHQQPGDKTPSPNIGDAEMQELALRLASGLATFWEMRGHFSEGRYWLETALERYRAYATPVVLMAESPMAMHERRRLELRALALCSLGQLTQHQDLRAARQLLEEALALQQALGNQAGIVKALQSLGTVVMAQGDHTLARLLLEESLTLAQIAQNTAGMATALRTLGYVSYDLHDYAAAERCFTQSLEICRAIGDQVGAGRALGNLGELARMAGEDDRAYELYRDCLATLREFGYAFGVASITHNMAHLALQRDELNEAHALFAEGLALYQALGSPIGVATCLAGLGAVALATGAPLRAARIFGATERLRASTTTVFSPADRESFQQYVANARAAVGSDANFTTAWNAGQIISLEECIVEALGNSPQPLTMSVAARPRGLCQD